MSQDQYKTLRKLFNSSIQGPNIESTLRTLAIPVNHLVQNMQAIHDNVYIATASEKYLDERLADYNLVRPPKVGLSDDIFREIGISIINRKQVRELLGRILSIIFGENFTQANTISANAEPYNLDDDDLLILSFDGEKRAEIKFTSSQFVNINAATAQEVADAITKGLKSQGKRGRAFVRENGGSKFVVLSSDTEGPSSSVQVLGGKAQNVLQFPEPRPTTGGPSTQWTLTLVSGGSVRFTWTGGANPSVGKVRVGDYVNIFGSGFDADNVGTFDITDVKGGSIGNAYFEIFNPNGVAEVVTQGTVDAVLFYNPIKKKINSNPSYAALFQHEDKLFEIFIPATTRVVRRDRRGAAHIHEPEIETTIYNPGKNKIVDITFPSPASVTDGSYFEINAVDGTQYYVYISNVPPVDPAPPFKIGIFVNKTGLTTATQLAQATAAAINANVNFNVATPSGPTIRVNWATVGAVSTPVNISVTGLTISVFQEGVNESTTFSSVPNPNELLPDQQGPYSYDLAQPFVLSEISTTLTAPAFLGSGTVLSVADSSNFPESESGLNYIVLNYGQNNQEGPIPYLSRPSSSSLLMSPSYVLKNIHAVGSEVRLVSQNGPVVVSRNGDDYPAYITDVVAGRIYAEELVKDLKAAGINLVIYILYPGDEGLAKYFTELSEKVIIWGSDEDV